MRGGVCGAAARTTQVGLGRREAAAGGTGARERPAAAGLATEGLVLDLQERDGGIFGSNLGSKGRDLVAEGLQVACCGGLGLGIPAILEPETMPTAARAWGAMSAQTRSPRRHGCFGMLTLESLPQ